MVRSVRLGFSKDKVWLRLSQPTIEKDKTRIMKKKLNHKKHKWKVIDSVDEKEDLIPTTITYNGETGSSPKRIGEILGEYFIKKVQDIRANFDDETEDAMKSFEYLIEKPRNTFNLKRVNINTTYEVINSMKLSNAKGDDAITSKIMKESLHFNAVAITHLFNAMLRDKKYPKVLKNARIVPLLKSGKSPNDPASYCPVSNLSVIDKVLESLLKNQLEEFMEKEGLIPDEHHGSRKDHSTMTCKMSLDNGVAETTDTKKHALVLSTDLTAAMDVVDHKLIIKKMKHLGVEDESLDLMENFLSDRSFVIDIQGFCTNKFRQPPWSIIQGSRFSGFLLNISTLKVPLLPRIMDNPELASEIAKRRIERTENVSHNSYSYVNNNCKIQ